MAQKLKGECLCGGVQYELEPAAMGVCHCTRCQRWTGSGGNPVFVVPQASLKVTQGGDLMHVYRSEGFSDRVFCTSCGSSLYGGGGSMCYVGAGTVRTPHDMTPTFHIMVAHRLPWDVIPEGTTQFPELPPE